MKKSNNIFLLLVVGFLSQIFFSCTNNEKKEEEFSNTPTSGELSLYADAGLKPVLDNMAFSFEAIYHRANINIDYTNENEAIQALYKDQCKTICINRNLNEKELKQMEAANLQLQIQCVAKSGLCIIAHPQSADSFLLVPEFKRFLSGEIQSIGQWTKILVDNANSGSTHYLKDSLIPEKAFGAHIKSSSSIDSLIGEVSNHPETIGILDFTLLADQDHPFTQASLKKIKIIPVAKEKGQPAFYPDQSNIQTGDYPFKRWVYLIGRSRAFGLSMGFITFVTGEKGQMILTKQGLAPYRQEERIIQFVNP